MHTTPSHVALDTTGTLNARTLHLGARTLSSSSSLNAHTYVSSSSALNSLTYYPSSRGVNSPYVLFK